MLKRITRQALMTYRSEVVIKHVRMRDPGRPLGESNSGYSIFDRLWGREMHRMRGMEKKYSVRR